MAQSAGRVSPGNNGQTDVGRGEVETLPVGTRMAPRGREQAVKGKLGMKPNSNAPDALVRKVPGRPGAINQLTD